MEANMYLMTAHKTIVGSDDGGYLVRLPASDDNIPKFINFDNFQTGDTIKQGPLLNFIIEITAERIAFTNNGIYLCALNNSAELVADREHRREWELFSII
jgi:hypothetical protein